MYNFRILINETTFGGDVEDRTPDLLLARQALSQLSYTPKNKNNKLNSSVNRYYRIAFDS